MKNLFHTGDLLAEMLCRYGVTHVFGMPGGQTAAFYDGVHRRIDRIQHVLVRDERSAAYAADAYARLTGKPGICDVTVGPGTTKLPDGLLEALNASIPLIAIVGDLPRDWEYMRDHGIGSQGFDQYAFLQSMTKRTWIVPNQKSLPLLVRSAFRVATSGRPGPVALIIPHDVLDQEWIEDPHDLDVDDRHTNVPAQRVGPSRQAVQDALELIGQAQRPALVVGGGIHSSKAYAALAEFAQRTDALVVTSFSGKGAISDASPLSGGVINPLGSPAAIELVQQADTLVWLGCKVGQNTSLNWLLPLPGQKSIQLDIDGTELGRTFRPDVAVVADVREFLELLLEKLPKVSRPDWRTEIARCKQQLDSRGKLATGTQGALNPAAVIQALAHFIGPDDVVVSDASFSAGWVAQNIGAQSAGRHFLFGRGLGGLGYAIPAAIGAASINTKGRVITVSGDGAASYALGELASHALHGLKTIHIVLNNGALGWLKIWEKLFFTGLSQSVMLESEEADISFAAVAKALGCEGHSVKEFEALNLALEKSFHSDKSTLIDVRTDVWATSVHGYERRLKTGEFYDRPGTVYESRPWVR